MVRVFYEDKGKSAGEYSYPTRQRGSLDGYRWVRHRDNKLCTFMQKRKVQVRGYIHKIYSYRRCMQDTGTLSGSAHGEFASTRLDTTSSKFSSGVPQAESMSPFRYQPSLASYCYNIKKRGGRRRR